MTRTAKVVTEKIPPSYRDLPKAERMVIARRLAAQLQAGLAVGGAGTISSQLRERQER
ncbi:MAG TPA: hypothetical protein VMV92_44375 [Streptosporangiaceae bacterium]|nr:hypothetical protein [Streptosporangiaceae bacterium]HVB44865.1 hypothetical protein [Streptosporangiaceae bacterium]